MPCGCGGGPVGARRGNPGSPLMRGVSRVSCDPRRRACLPAPSKSSPLRPSVFQAGHIPSCGGSWECYALSPVAGACCWSLLLLSPLLSTRRRPSCSKPTRTLQGMARVWSGQAPAWPLVSVRSVRRGSRVKRDFACTLARAFPPVLVVLRAQSRLGLEGRARTLSGPSPDLTSSCQVSSTTWLTCVKPGRGACGVVREWP